MDFMILQEKIHIMHCKNKTRRTTATITTTTTKISQQQHPPHLNNLGFFICSVNENATLLENLENTCSFLSYQKTLILFPNDSSKWLQDCFSFLPLLKTYFSRHLLMRTIYQISLVDKC